MIPVRNARWYSVQAGSARMFQLYEWIEAGATLGAGCSDGLPVQAEEEGEIIEVQYDLWHDRVIVVLAPEGSQRVRRVS